MQNVRGVISGALAAANEIRAAETTDELVITAFAIVAASAVSATFKAGATALSGAIPCGANGGICTPFHPEGHFIIPPGSNFNVTLDDTVQVSGWYTGYLRPIFS